MPACENIGVPARWEPSKRGPSGERDLAYTLQKGKGIPGIRCKACGDGPPVKSNAAIARELARLSRESDIWRPEELTGCRNAQCENHARPISSHPDAYCKRGKPPSGQGQICLEGGVAEGLQGRVAVEGQLFHGAQHLWIDVDHDATLAVAARARGVPAAGRLTRLVA